MYRILPIKFPYQLYQQIPMHHSYLNLLFLDIYTFCEYMVKVIAGSSSHSYNRYTDSLKHSSVVEQIHCKGVKCEICTAVC